MIYSQEHFSCTVFLDTDVFDEFLSVVLSVSFLSITLHSEFKISLIILLGSSIHALANSSDNRPVNKYYTSITVENGDTLWDIADEYISGYDIDKNDYIAEVSALNNLSKDEIHAGQSIVVAYYTRDVK